MEEVGVADPCSVAVAAAGTDPGTAGGEGVLTRAAAPDHKQPTLLGFVPARAQLVHKYWAGCSCTSWWVGDKAAPQKTRVHSSLF